jgi:NAD(P)-dependent dehydrogenase (short-subunit alcohol dehydrogenase family)
MRKVVVTGGTKRIGAAIAQAFEQASDRVFAHSRRKDADPGLSFDLDDPDMAAGRFAAFLRESGPVDVLVLNASTFSPDELGAIDPVTLRAALRANLESQVLLVREFMAHRRSLPDGAAGPAVTIVLLDQKLSNPNPDFASYTLAKYGIAGLVHMAEAWETADAMRIYGLAPGLTLPSHDQTEDEFGTSSRMNLLGRQNRAEEIAEACVFLARGLLRNGSVVLSDSGQHLVPQRRDVMYEIRN